MEGLAIRALLVILVSGGLLGTGYYRGHKSATDSAEKERVKSVERAVKQNEEIAKQDQEVSAGYEARRVARDKIYVTVEKEVIREIPAKCIQCRMSDLGLGMLNNALAGKFEETASPGKSDESVRNPKPPRPWNFPGIGSQDSRDVQKTL